jgi:hypothetical protein
MATSHSSAPEDRFSSIWANYAYEAAIQRAIRVADGMIGELGKHMGEPAGRRTEVVPIAF